jgi:hypothetical protein
MEVFMDFQATEDKVKICGRTIYREGVRYLGYSATSVSFCFTGKEAHALILSDPDNWPKEHHAWIGVFLGGEQTPAKRVELTKLRQDVTLYHADHEETVTITIMKFSEPEYAICGIESLHIDTDKLLPPPAPKSRKIQLIGDSITCGYGVEGSPEDTLHDTAVENPVKAYSVKTARALDADFEIVAWNGKGIISAYIGDEDQADDSWLIPMLYEYTDAGCCQQFFHEPPSLWESWDHHRFEPDLVTLFLGTNDASYTKNIPERKKGFSLMYQSFLRKIHNRHPQAKILCMLGTMDMSLCSTVNHAVKEFCAACPDAEVKYLQLPIQDEATDSTGTFWHPTEATHEKIAALVTASAKKLMGWE